jgi:uncharacterized protein YndB with AHSA1/START domain
MADIIHRVGIKAPISNVYAAVSTVEGVANWWTKETTGVAKPGDTIDVRFLSPSGTEIGAMTMDVLTLEPHKRAHWRFKKGPAEWIGTDVTFDLYQDGDYTILLFGHRNWREPVEFMAHCSMKWATFMLSLKELVETGRGKPSPNDMKIDNWN